MYATENSNRSKCLKNIAWLKYANNNIFDTLVISELSKTADKIKFEKTNDAIDLSLEATQISHRLLQLRKF